MLDGSAHLLLISALPDDCCHRESCCFRTPAFDAFIHDCLSYAVMSNGIAACDQEHQLLLFLWKHLLQEGAHLDSTSHVQWLQD